MKHYLLLGFALCSQFLFADKAELRQQLSNVNSYWNMQPELPEDILRQFGVSAPTNYNGWITLHLKLVEQTLRSKNVSHLTSTQQANRVHLLDELNGYWKAGLYPVNDYKAYTTPVFIDRKGTHCAVGYLMQQSGNDALAQSINTNEQFAYVHEIKTEGVKQWADEHGFTLDELAWIQPTYSPKTLFATVDGGTNGPVNALLPNYGSGGLFVAGSFDTVDNTPCRNIALYKNGQLGCYGGGVAGEVTDLYLAFNELLAAGEFVSAGTMYPLAVFNNSVGSWSYVSIPTVPGAVGKAVFTGGWGYKLELVITNPSTGTDEIWYQKANGNWERQAIVNGVVNDIEASYYGRLYVGSFDSVIVTRPNQSDTLLLTHNVVLNDYGAWFNLPNVEVSDTVFVVKVIGGATYFGGTCSDSVGRSNVCLTRYLNGTFQAVLLSSWFSTWSASIHDVQLFDSYRLILAGEFDFSPMGGTGTENIALYDLGMNYLQGYGMFNKRVNTVAEWNDNWYFGGEFTSDIKNPSLPYLAKLDMTNSISNFMGTVSVNVYPNPTSDVVRIQTDGLKITSIELTDVTGKRALQVTPNTVQHDVSVSELAAGVYTVRVITNSGVSVSRLVKN